MNSSMTELAQRVHDDILYERVKHLPDVHVWLETSKPLDPDNDQFGVWTLAPSAACVAGWVSHSAGDAFVYYHEDYAGPVGDHHGYWCRHVACGGRLDAEHLVEVEYRAQHLLGLSDNAATELFDPTNTRDRVLYILSELAVGTPESRINWHLGGYRRRDFPPNARAYTETDAEATGYV